MKNIAKKLFGFFLALAIVAALLPSASVKAAATITLTFRAGDVGSFDVEKANSIANDCVEVTENYVKIKVTPENGMTLGDVLLAGFGTTNADAIFGSITEHEGYALLSAKEWGVDSEASVTRNSEYVLDYGVLVNPVMYTIRFMDVDSYNEATGLYEREVTAPYINYGNAGDVITFASPIVNQYATTAKDTTFTLSAENANVVAFYYAYTGVVYAGPVTYEDVYQYLSNDQIITIPLPNTNNGGNAQGNADAGNNDDNGGNADNGDNGNNIDDQNVPLDDGDDVDDNNGGNDDGNTNIDDVDPPLGFLTDAILRNALIGAGVAVVLAAGLVVFLVNKNKKKKVTINTEEKHEEK